MAHPVAIGHSIDDNFVRHSPACFFRARVDVRASQSHNVPVGRRAESVGLAQEQLGVPQKRPAGVRTV